MITMEPDELIAECQDAIVKVYKEQGLTSLSGLDDKFILNGKNILAWHLEVISMAPKQNDLVHYTKNMDDIFWCSSQLLYFTANLYLYRPHINSPLKHAYLSGNETIYPNFQNIAGRRYDMFADIVCQTAYNYWDRIGDLIASFFPKEIKKDRVYFSTVLDMVPEQFHVGESFSWLQNFRDNGYQELNEKRKQIVHYTTSGTQYKFAHLQSVHSREEIESLQTAREGVADFFKQHIYLTLEGYEKTLLFLSDVSSKLFPAVPD